VRAGGRSGTITVRAQSRGLAPASAEIATGGRKGF